MKINKVRLVAFVLALVPLSSCAASTGDEELTSYSPADARHTCRSLLLEFAEGKGSDMLISKLSAGGQIKGAEAAELFAGSDFPAAGLAFAYSIGNRETFEAMWPIVRNHGSEVLGDWKWSLLSESVLCANNEAVKFLLGKGLDPNMTKEGVSDLMTVAVMNRDLEMARILFQAGYDRCDSVKFKGDDGLIDLAGRVDLLEFKDLYIKNCPRE